MGNTDSTYSQEDSKTNWNVLDEEPLSDVTGEIQLRRSVRIANKKRVSQYESEVSDALVEQFSYNVPKYKPKQREVTPSDVDDVVDAMVDAVIDEVLAEAAAESEAAEVAEPAVVSATETTEPAVVSATAVTHSCRYGDIHKNNLTCDEVEALADDPYWGDLQNVCNTHGINFGELCKDCSDDSDSSYQVSSDSDCDSEVTTLELSNYEGSYFYNDGDAYVIRITKSGLKRFGNYILLMLGSYYLISNNLGEF